MLRVSNNRRYLERTEGWPFLDRVPDQSALPSGLCAPGAQVQVCRGGTTQYAMAYPPLGWQVCPRTSALTASALYAPLHNPSDGEWMAVGPVVGGETTLAAPSSGRGQNWLLALTRPAPGA